MLVAAGVAVAVVFALVGSGAGSTAGPTVAGSTAPTGLASAPPTSMPTGTPTTTPAPVATPNDPGVGGVTTPDLRTASATQTVSCPVPGEGPAGSTAESPDVQLVWSSEGAQTAFVGVDTQDAQAEPYSEVSTSGSISIPFACPAASHTYTITLVGAGGARSKTFTVQNTGHRG
ncbi:hypothetical protein B7R54_13470 [Subtercola boreus]|uniref:Ig-like domain-containing protein n=1 Tax=Subtercola boreus TaxID=120213 RepID=A0A3E0VKU5_9MICO|nr:hypothetical protein B7R54_13470 [Subtercola boreus]